MARQGKRILNDLPPVADYPCSKKHLRELAETWDLNEVRFLSRNVDYGDYLDEECRSLCNAMNSVKGIQTSSCCCGHGKTPLDIYFHADDWAGLFFVTRCFDRRYGGGKWKIDASVGDIMYGDTYPVNFRVSTESVGGEKFVGKEAYKAADEMVENFNEI